MARIGFRNPFFVKRVEDQQRIGSVPFVHLFGHEKAWGQPEPHDFNKMVAAYESWAYACAWKNATSVASNKIKLFKKTGKGDSENMDEITEHPFLDVITSVNAFSNRFELFTITQVFLELTGNAYWWVPKDRFGVPFMIWNIPANWVKIVPSKEKYIEGYKVQAPGQGRPIPFEEEEVIHFKFPSPFSLFYGCSPLLAAKYGIDLNKHAKTWGINYFMNDARPGGILTTEEMLGDAEYKRLQDAWNKKHRGDKNAGKMAILMGGLQYQQTGTNVKDARFDLVNKDIRNEILAMFGVPPSKLGLVEDVNRANADANDYTYQKETVVPRLTLIEEKITEKFLRFYPQDEGVDIVAKFDNPVPEDKEYRLREKQINVQTGITTIDEERAKEGLDPFNLPETSKPLIPFSLTPAGEEKPSLNAFGNQTDNSDDEDKDDKKKAIEQKSAKKWRAFINATNPYETAMTASMRRYFQEQQSEVMRNIANFKAIKKDLYSQIIFSLVEQNEKLRLRVLSYIKNAYSVGILLGANEVGSSIDFDVLNPNIERAVDVRLRWFSDNVNSTTAKLVKEAINSGFQNGESIEQIARRVDRVYDYSRDYRSKRIAQTEVIGAANDGQLSSYKEAGVKMKAWLTAGDEKVRDSHRGIKAVGINDSFTTGDGNHLLYPGDRSSGASAGDVINCRCTVSPIV